METKYFDVRQQQKVDSPSAWEGAKDFVPLKGEIIVYQDNEVTQLKVGDGVTSVEDLDFISGGEGGGGGTGTIDLPLSRGTGKKTLVFNSGIANGDYSFAGGTNDKSLLGGIVGTTIANTISVAKPTANGGLSLAFGAGSIAHGGGSMALGANVQAGWLGYYIWDVDTNTNKITLSTNQRTNRLPIIGTARKKPNEDILAQWSSSVNNEQAFVEIINGSIYHARLTAVDAANGTITVDNLGFSDLSWPITSTWGPNDMTIFLIPAPSMISNVNAGYSEAIGEVRLGFGALSTGFGNIAAGTAASSIGIANAAINTAAFVTGRENVGSFAALVGGYRNRVTGPTAFSAGENNLVQGKAAVALGVNSQALADAAVAIGNTTTAECAYSLALNASTQARANCATALGHGTITAKQFDDQGLQRENAPGYAQLVVGRYNAYENGEIDNALFVVGNGSDGNRANAFIVRKNGIVEIPGSIRVNNNYLQFTNTTGTDMLRIHGNEIRADSNASEGIVTVGPNYSGGFRFETVKTSTGGVAMCATLGARKEDETDSFGAASLSIGSYAMAGGTNSAAFGYGAKTISYSQVAVGKWNAPESKYLFMVGNGSETARKNAFTVSTDDSANFTGAVTINGAVRTDNTLTVIGALDVGDQADFNSSISVARDASVEGQLIVKGPTHLTDSLSVEGSTTFTNSIEIKRNGTVRFELNKNIISSTSGEIENLFNFGKGISGGFRMDTVKIFKNGTYSIAAALKFGAMNASDTDPFGAASLSIGAHSKACGSNSVALGWGAKTSTAAGQIALGRYNDYSKKIVSDTVSYDGILFVGNGNESQRKNALAVYRDDSVVVTGELSFGSLSASSITTLKQQTGLAELEERVGSIDSALSEILENQDVYMGAIDNILVNQNKYIVGEV